MDEGYGMKRTAPLITTTSLLLCAAAPAPPPPARQAASQAAPLPSEIPAQFMPQQVGFDYVERSVMIPMRDGVKLRTVILIPRGTRNAPILLTRTPSTVRSRGYRKIRAPARPAFSATATSRTSR
jgi:predicted acyl esterase